MRVSMKLESMHIGLKVRHPEYGEGAVKGLSERAAEVLFNEGSKTLDPQVSELQPAEGRASLSGLELPLADLIELAVDALVGKLGLQSPRQEAASVVEALGVRWHKGRMVLHPADTALQPKEVPLEVFFHKIVMMRNNLRVLEQKINAHPTLSDAEKIDMQEYITRCYGSMTTFNMLFRNKEEQFSAKS